MDNPLINKMELTEMSTQELCLRIGAHLQTVRLWYSGMGLPGPKYHGKLEAIFPGVVDELREWKESFQTEVDDD